jgi:hypothetical protein
MGVDRIFITSCKKEFRPSKRNGKKEWPFSIYFTIFTGDIEK